jgi:N-succinyldiaminopimelate aminotransferase
MASLRQPFLSSRLQGFGTSIFTSMTQLAMRFDALNLGQGFPSFDGPDELKDAAIAAIRSGQNQYVRMMGLPELTRAVATHQKRFYGLDYDPDSEVTVTNGATEALHSTLQALLESGDEVIVFEPFYDSYRPCIAMAGGVDRRLTLRAPDFSFDPDDLRRLVNAKTRALILNSPHNPTGKVFSAAEIESIATICREHDLLVIADEVYEHLTFDVEHRPIATWPGLFERTVTISSTGKTFSMTGWKVGYACAPAELSAAIRCAHQFVTFCNSGPFQPAMAQALALPDEYFADFRAQYRSRRDLLCAGLRRVGFGVRESAGTYFVLADIRPLGYDDDIAFCRMMPEKVGVAAIPASAFYVDKEAGRHLIRFAFCKSIELLEEGLRRLEKL